MPKRSDQFQTIRTEGALLPPDILQSIASLKVEGVSPKSYHLPPGVKLNEAIAQSWSVLQKHWKGFQEARQQLDPDKPGTEITNQNWLLPLFEELKYGRLTTVKSPEIDGRIYAIERFYAGQPIHLIGCNLPLDRRTTGARGAATASPHSMMQEYLNRSENGRWGFLSNGLVLRILRDNVSLSRQAYVEFNLESMMAGEVYADFALLWMLGHQSRVEAEKPQDCWLEKWSQLARDLGTRVLSDLRNGVAKAIEALGRGFLSHPRNDRLREKLQSGQLGTQDYYRQLLRVVYRLLFLFVAEDRELLHPPGAGERACKLYDAYYSTRRLRELADRLRGSKHADLWQALSLVFDALGRPAGCSELGLSALGSFLWQRSSTPDLLAPAPKGSESVVEPSLVANEDLLAAVRALAFVEQDKVRRGVDYRNLGSEELGSVYESLLELHPIVNVPARTFELSLAAGNERKTTGSYYTPESLVQCLLDSALDPVVEDRLQGKKGADAESALLDIKVCDPACGSGHFLIAAAHRLARRLARVRTGESEPSPTDYQRALRDVIGHCIFGVDINPMAVELCKVSLWMEAIEPGRPLSFLDHHIQCGNALLGATPALLAKGIPDEAFTPIEGDDRKLCTEYKKQNRDERRGQKHFLTEETWPWERLGDLATSLARLDVMSDDTPTALRQKEDRYAELVRSAGYLSGRFWADTWCAAFVWKKTKEFPYGITEEVFRQIERNPHSAAPWLREEVERLRDQYEFFHWHVAFPGVFRVPPQNEAPENEYCGWNYGFDLVLGNPPWDTLSPDQREFFGQFQPGIRSLGPAEQKEIIETLLSDTVIDEQWAAHCRVLYATVHFLKASGRYALFAPGNLGKGDFNIYRMFAETALRHARKHGFAAMVVPAGIYAGANASAIRKFMLDQCELTFLFGLSNTKRGWFEKVDIDRFAAFAVRVGGRTSGFNVLFGLSSPEDLGNPPVRLEADVIRVAEPETYAIGDVRSSEDVLVSQKMYAACPAFGDQSAGPPHRHYQREVDMGNDRDLFSIDPQGLPLYEGRMIDHFDHRAKTYVSGHGNSAKWKERAFSDPEKAILPQWRILRADLPKKVGDRVDKYRLGFADVANPRNERSLVCTLIPPNTVCGHTVPTILFDEPYEWAYLPLLALANSFVIDALARSRLTSPHMTFTHMDAMPFPRLGMDDPFVRRAAPLVLRLVCTSPEMTGYWNKMAALGFASAAPPGCIPPAALIEEHDRACVRAELDALAARRVYGITHSELSAIMDSFPVLRRREGKAFGSFKTKQLILEAYERLDAQT